MCLLCLKAGPAEKLPWLPLQVCMQNRNCLGGQAVQAGPAGFHTHPSGKPLAVWGCREEVCFLTWLIWLIVILYEERNGEGILWGDFASAHLLGTTPV